MQPFTLRLILLVLALSGSLAASPRNDVWRARELLPGGTWSTVLEIRNTRLHPLYPRTTHALIFEFNRLLWLYTPYDGTQSLSRTLGTTLQDRDNLGPLLQRVWHGFSAFRQICSPPKESSGSSGVPPGACVLASIAALHDRSRVPPRHRNASLLFIYLQDQEPGHTVLLYETESGRFVLDPSRSPAPVRVTSPANTSPAQIARELYPRKEIAGARMLRIETAREQARSTTSAPDRVRLSELSS